MDDLFDVLIESGGERCFGHSLDWLTWKINNDFLSPCRFLVFSEISPLIGQDPPSLEKPLPVTASVSTLPINSVLTRPPPLVQVAQMPAAPLSSPGNNLLGDTEAQRLKLMEELNSPVVEMEMNFSENIPPSGATLQNTSVDSMDWLDLTLSVPSEGISPLDMSVSGAVFSSDFLDSHELHLNWD